ncbi:isochorismate synthase [Gordonia hankookensis]|uniref:isochorismate synthase n=1 Tax=Gordonia hankookensis TaxID=589403 RepID=A0ABR7WBK7_9ACTN|nr:isochorismate synthase [Gordonia hankookensis]MBD1319232.1 isochorismate synthase [Gordonia hankookensis]
MANPDADGADPDVFILSRPTGSVVANGVRRGFVDARAAAEALRTGAVDAVVGAIPFDVDDPAALITPGTLVHSARPVAGSPGAPHQVLSMSLHPDQPTHRDRVERAIKQIADGELDKVVLARSVDVTLDPAVDVDDLIRALAQGNSEGNAFGVDVGAARGSGGWLVGASPELLVRKQGRTVTCHPYAGSAPRSADPATDRAAADALAASAKDRTEHAFVVDYLRDRLTPHCVEITVPPSPELRSTGEIWHLATPIHGTLRDEDMTALDLALLLSPTPAVCGTPSDLAARFIRDVEGERGLYGGAIGWCDGAGDGEWMVTIRCLELTADRRSLRTWAGGGIVAQSDPGAEVDETTAKLRTVFNALGIETRPNP